MPFGLERVTKPTWTGPSRAARMIANKIDNPQGEGGALRGFLGGAVEGAGDVLSDMTSPLSIASYLMGTSGISRLARLGRVARPAMAMEQGVGPSAGLPARMAGYANVHSDIAAQDARIAENLAKVRGLLKDYEKRSMDPTWLHDDPTELLRRVGGSSMGSEAVQATRFGEKLAAQEATRRRSGMIRGRRGVMPEQY